MYWQNYEYPILYIYMNLFETICRNSFSFPSRAKKVEEKKKEYEENNCFNKKYHIFVESLVPHLMCPIGIIEEHTKEKYNFVKHIQPLVKDKLIFIREWTNSFPHSEEIAKKSLKRHGIVCDYKDNKKLYLQFHLGKVDPNKGKTMGNIWI